MIEHRYALQVTAVVSWNEDPLDTLEITLNPRKGQCVWYLGM